MCFWTPIFVSQLYSTIVLVGQKERNIRYSQITHMGSHKAIEFAYNFIIQPKLPKMPEAFAGAFFDQKNEAEIRRYEDAKRRGRRQHS